jgi:predicted RNA-binding Zn ribbon-like protein
MIVGSSARLGLQPAPAGLSFVQELLNTAGGDPVQGLPDLLDLLPAAQAWLDDALVLWAAQTDTPAPAIVLAEADLGHLRTLRERLSVLLAADPRKAGDLAAHRVVLQVRDGVARYRPTGSGWRAVAGLVLAETLLAQRDATWARLKVCANPACRASFYDRSRNGSRVWHDTQVCGNRINLRASRARRARSAATSAAGVERTRDGAPDPA